MDDAAPELLTATSDEVALLIACYLTNPIDLLHLALVCRRYAAKSFGAASPNPVGAVAAVGPDEWTGGRWSMSLHTPHAPLAGAVQRAGARLGAATA